MEHQREEENMVLHVTRHIVKAMDVATIRSVKTGGGTKASVCWLSQHTAPTSTNQLSCILLLTLMDYGH